MQLQTGLFVTPNVENLGVYISEGWGSAGVGFYSQAAAQIQRDIEFGVFAAADPGPGRHGVPGVPRGTAARFLYLNRQERAERHRKAASTAYEAGQLLQAAHVQEQNLARRRAPRVQPDDPSRPAGAVRPRQRRHDSAPVPGRVLAEHGALPGPVQEPGGEKCSSGAGREGAGPNGLLHALGGRDAPVHGRLRLPRRRPRRRLFGVRRAEQGGPAAVSDRPDQQTGEGRSGAAGEPVRRDREDREEQVGRAAVPEALARRAAVRCQRHSKKLIKYKIST